MCEDVCKNVCVRVAQRTAYRDDTLFKRASQSPPPPPSLRLNILARVFNLYVNCHQNDVLGWRVGGGGGRKMEGGIVGVLARGKM